MTESETLAPLTSDDIAKIKAEKMGNGCLWVVAVPALLVFLFFVIRFVWIYDYLTMSSVLTPAVILGISLLILFPLYNFIKKKDAQIARDIAAGQKKVIVAPITDKRIDSSEITSGRDKGGITSNYFMTVAGIEYPMSERKYLLIPVGEFMEIHQAPVSKIVLKEIWLKKDGTVEEDKIQEE